MARIPENFNIGDYGDPKELTIEKLLLILERLYTDLAVAVNSKPDLYQRETDGQAGDAFLANGSLNINLLTNKVEMLTNHTGPSTVTWTTLS